MNQQRGNSRAALAIVAASGFITASSFLAKGAAGRFESLTTESSLHPLQITAGRFIFGLLIWLGVVMVRREPLRDVHWQLHIARSFFGWVTVSSIFWASSLMVLSDATAISFLTPVFTLVFASLFLGESAGIIRMFAVGIMLAGAMILLRPGTGAFQPAALIALLAAVTSAIELLLIKRLTVREPRLQILLVNNAIGCIIALAAASLVWQAPNPAQWAVMVAVGASMAGAQVLILTGLRTADASYAAPFMYSALIFAGILDFLVFGDSPDAFGAVGAIVIVVGAIMLALMDKASKAF